MMGAAFSWINNCAADLDGVPDLFAGGFSVLTVDPAYPLTNLLDPDASLFARFYFTNANATTSVIVLQFTWNAALSDRVCRVGAVVGARLPAGVERLYWRGVDPTGAVGLGDSVSMYSANFVPAPEQVGVYDLIPTLWTADVTCARAWLLIDIAGSASGTIDIGYVHCGPALVFPDGVAETWADDVIDASVVEIGPSGAMAALELPVRGALEIPFDREDYAKVIGSSGAPTAPSMRTLRRQAGLHTPILAIMRDATAFELQVHSVFGRITQLPRFVHDGGNLISTSMRVEQLRG